MFGVCPNLISLDLSSFSFKNVKSMAYMFNGCKKLSTLILPKENITSTALQDIKYLFYDCKELTSIDLSGFNFFNVKDLSSMFYNCCNLETLILPSNEKASNVTDFSYILFFNIIYNNNFIFCNLLIFQKMKKQKIFNY
jgi:surface protein